MIIFLLLVLIVVVCMVAIYFHIKTLAWKIERLEAQHADLKKMLDEKNSH
jgi:Tfp pilus assembly protein PilO